MLQTEDEIRVKWEKDDQRAQRWARDLVANLGHKEAVIYELEMVRLEILELRLQLADRGPDTEGDKDNG